MSAPLNNKFAIGNRGGRPAAYEDTLQLSNEINAYFDNCISSKEKATITGLTLFLGFQSRSSLDDYCKKDNEFSYIIKRAKLAVENSYELSGQTIDIFALKNMGWKDQSEIKHDIPRAFINIDPLADDNSTDNSTKEDLTS